MRRAGLAQSGATMVASWLMAVATGTIYRDVLFTTHALLVAAAVCLPGLVARLLAWEGRGVRWLVWSGQVAAGLGALGLIVRRPVADVLEEAREPILTGFPPLAASVGLSGVFLALVWLMTVLMENAVGVWRRPGLAVAPLVGWYAILTSIPGWVSPWWTAAATTVAIAVVLAADAWGGARRWRRNVAGDTGTGDDLTVSVIRSAVVVVVAATVLGLVAAQLSPVRERDDSHAGSRSASRSKMSDPRLDLRAALHASQSWPVLSYRTDGAEGVRLRLAILDQLDDTGWGMTAGAWTKLDSPQAVLPPMPGPAAGTGIERSTHVEIDTFPSEFLPLPYAPVAFTAADAWGFDESTLAVHTLSRRGPAATNHLRYDVTSRELVPSAAQVQAVATTSGAPAHTTVVPPEVPADVRALAQEVTAVGTTPGEKASLLQAYFREGDFTYDLDRAPTEAGFVALQRFLFTERRGYCEHFAVAYATMARSVGLPSRVVIGFLPGTLGPDGAYVVTNRAMHAWVEVWFDGYGWLTFDPTPGAVSGAAPPYALDRGTIVAKAQPSASPSAVSAAPTEPVPDTATAPTVDVRHRASSGAWLLGIAALGAVVALLGSPALWRRHRRRQRLAGRASTLQPLWEEVRDTVLDIGGEWPAESPRSLAARVGAMVPAELAPRVTELAVAVERERFAAQPGPAPAGMGEIAREVVDALLATASGRLRWESRWLPRSLWRR